MKSILSLLAVLLLSTAAAGCGQSEDIQQIAVPHPPKQRIVLRPDERGEQARTVTWSDDGSRKVQEMVDYKDGSRAIVSYGSSGSISEIKEFFSRTDNRLRRHTIMSPDGKTPLRDSVYKLDGTLERSGRLLANGDFEINDFVDGYHISRHQVLERVGNKWLISSEELRNQKNLLLSLSKFDPQLNLLVTTRFDENGRETTQELWGRDRKRVKVLEFASDKVVSKISIQTEQLTEVTTFRSDGTRKEIRRWERPHNLTVEKFDENGMLLFRQSWILENDRSSPGATTASLASIELVGQSSNVTRIYYFENGVLRYHIIQYFEDGNLEKVLFGDYLHGELLREEVRDRLGNVLETLPATSESTKPPPADYLRYDHAAQPDFLGSKAKE